VANIEVAFFAAIEVKTNMAQGIAMDEVESHGTRLKLKLTEPCPRATEVNKAERTPPSGGGKKPPETLMLEFTCLAAGVSRIQTLTRALQVRAFRALYVSETIWGPAEALYPNPRSRVPEGFRGL